MKQLTAKEVRELRKRERALIDNRMRELVEDDVVNCLLEKSDGNRTYDFDPIAWKLDKIENPEDWKEEIE